MEGFRKLLDALGWKPSHIDCYIGLLQTGALTVRALHEHLDRKTDARSTREDLNQLEKLGAVTRTDGNPHDNNGAKFEAQNPRFVVNQAMDYLTELKQDAMTEAEEAWEQQAELKARHPDFCGTEASSRFGCKPCVANPSGEGGSARKCGEHR
jgi:sugar-specific transcriptional regulator TrmB